MTEAKTEQDPSIEEILESIRHMINEEDEAPAAPAPERKLEALSLPPEEPEDHGAPLELTAAAEEPQDDLSGVINLTDKVENLSRAEENLGEDLMNPAYDPDPRPQIDLQEPQMTQMAPIDQDESLLSEKTADAAAAEMAKLLANNVAIERDEPGRVGHVTLEDIARDLMRPLIKTWLDENLPRVIERVVTRELEKIARRARDE